VADSGRGLAADSENDRFAKLFRIKR
jgi:hypothetical protein